MNYSLFNFCSQSAQSRGHWEALVGLAPQNKAPSPPIWNMKHYKLLEFCQFIKCQAHLFGRKLLDLLVENY